MYDTIYFKSGETKPPGHKRDLIQCFEKSGCETSIGIRRQAPQGQSRAVACQLYPPPAEHTGTSLFRVLDWAILSPRTLFVCLLLPEDTHHPQPPI